MASYFLRAIALLGSGLFVPAGHAGAASSAARLAGSEWELVAIQSMDDAQGTLRVADPAAFTLQLGADGRAALKLDCNRGTASWKATPAADGGSGQITFGPVAGTRALCPPPHLDERIVRDLGYVRGYLLRDGNLYLSLMADGGIYEWVPQQAGAPAADSERTVKTVHFAKGKSSAVIRDRIVGYRYIDYQLRAGAGQRLTVSLKGSNGANYFNLLPPESDGPAMAMGERLDNHFEGLLPDDGVYTIRVFLYRAAARRGEHSDFTLSVGVTGTALKPVPARTDAVLPGTRFHAGTTVPCEPAFTKTRQCEAFVVRRGFDGTATVEVRWDGTGKRRILFVKGLPKAADVPQAMTFTRNERGWRVTFNGDEHFEIPEPLVLGG
jgi:heat shock protein HslJ